MGGVSLVGVDSTVSSVRSSSSLGCLLNNKVGDFELVDVETVDLSVGLGVLEET